MHVGVEGIIGRPSPQQNERLVRGRSSQGRRRALLKQMRIGRHHAVDLLHLSRRQVFVRIQARP